MVSNQTFHEDEFMLRSRAIRHVYHESNRTTRRQRASNSHKTRYRLLIYFFLHSVGIDFIQ